MFFFFLLQHLYPDLVMIAGRRSLDRFSPAVVPLALS